MDATTKSIYEELILESNDQSRSVDLTQGALSFEYFEDIFSPVITARLKVIDTSASIENDGVMQSIYNGLPLRGGERLSIRIKANTSSNISLDFASRIEDYFYVSSVSDVLAEQNNESFTLQLVSKEAISNETSRVSKKYQKSQSIDISVKNILEDVLQTNKIGVIDKTSNNYGFVGNMRKPFTVLTWLASKCVPSVSKSATAGFLFYQTKDGFQFRSIDEMNKQEPKASYIYSEKNETFNDSGKVNNDFKILDYYIDRNSNLLEKVRLGTYSSQRIYFNPLNFSFTTLQQGVFKQSDYIGETETLGDRFKLPKTGEGSDQTLGDLPSRIITQVLDIGTMEQDVTVEENSDPAQYQSQALMRYNTMMTQKLNMMVPLNTNLSAGNLIECNFPRLSSSDQNEFDQETSGLYMIKELCHHFDTKNSYTSLKLIRDSFGQKNVR